MDKCFVIQPFDGAKFDKRYRDVFDPAIREAGLQPYRVDEDHSVTVPIESIETEIKNSRICFADITLDKPNIWYELGYAFASNRPVVMVCSDERGTDKFPFDVQHKNILKYKSESASDFEKLRTDISKRLRAQLSNTSMIEELARQDVLVPVAGLSVHEETVLAVLAGSSWVMATLHKVREDAERAGLTSVGFNLSVRRLQAKGFVNLALEWDGHGDQQYDVITLSDGGWEWIDKNESRFALQKPRIDDSDKIPF